MKKEKHDEILKEVLDEIEAASKDSNGLVSHQRRLAFLLSLGAETLLELYFHKQDIIKEGSRIDHRWFKKRKENVLKKVQDNITSQVKSIKNIDEIINKMREIEEKRDDLAYGAPATEDILQEKINLFFELKKLIKC
ncbi:MAG: hypothetical protein KKG75_02760 [Nanoarchaeota archaeon]|nr:hypothetical protein [Nanoarchaeota archaeon]